MSVLAYQLSPMSLHTKRLANSQISFFVQKRKNDNNRKQEKAIRRGSEINASSHSLVDISSWVVNAEIHNR